MAAAKTASAFEWSVVLLDLSAAFDTVEHRTLTDVLQSRFGVTGAALSWHKTYLSERSYAAPLMAAAKTASAFEWPAEPYKIASYPWGSAPPYNIWFLQPTRDFSQNGISISSAVFAQLTAMSHYITIGR